MRFLDPARQEVRDAVHHYESARPGLGRQFLEELRQSVERIQNHPNAWHPLVGDVRRCMTRRFPYGLIYQVRDDGILIVAVAHLHREPTYWYSRIDT